MNWIIPCNPEAYDIESAFNTRTIIDWKQAVNFSVGDTVFIYVSNPIKSIRYQCEVIKTDIPNIKYFQEKDILDGSVYMQTGRYVRLRLIKKLNSEYLDYKMLEKNGLKNQMQGPLKINAQLSSYLVSVLLRRSKRQKI